jgi:cell division protein FtsL
MTIIGKLLNPGSRPRSNRKANSRLSSAVSSALANVDGLLRPNRATPLHLQKQWIPIFLVVIVLVVIVTGLSLNISARKAFVGREIQRLQEDITTNERLNSDMQTQIAGLLSNSSLEQRALAQGFTPVKDTDLKYVAVPGYFPKQAVNLASQAPKVDQTEMPAEYSESLFTWIVGQLEIASLPLANAR